MSSPNYAGARAAIRQFFEAAWAGRTPVAYPNVQASGLTVDGEPVPWVRLEIINDGAELVGVGAPGNRVYRYDGAIEVSVFVPAGTGDEQAATLATAAGEIFRAREFYNDVPGYSIRSKVPGMIDTDIVRDNGKWYGVAVTIPFEYWHRA